MGGEVQYRQKKRSRGDRRLPSPSRPFFGVTSNELPKDLTLVVKNARTEAHRHIEPHIKNNWQRLPLSQLQFLRPLSASSFKCFLLDWRMLTIRLRAFGHCGRLLLAHCGVVGSKDSIIVFCKLKHCAPSLKDYATEGFQTSGTKVSVKSAFE